MRYALLLIPLILIPSIAFATNYCNCDTVYPAVVYNPPNDYRLYDINNYTGTQLWQYFLSPHNYEVVDYVKGHSYPSNYTLYLQSLNIKNNYTKSLTDSLIIIDNINSGNSIGNQYSENLLDNLSLIDSIQTVKNISQNTSIQQNTTLINYLKVNCAPEPSGNAPSGQIEIYVYCGTGVAGSLDAFSNSEYFVLTHHKTDIYQFSISGSGTIFVPPEGQETQIESLARVPERSLGSLEFFDCLIQTNSMSGITKIDLMQNGGTVVDENLNGIIEQNIQAGSTGTFSLPQLNTNVYSNTQMYLRVSSNSPGTISGICYSHY